MRRFVVTYFGCAISQVAFEGFGGAEVVLLGKPEID
jgi:hypothetical protein